MRYSYICISYSDFVGFAKIYPYNEHKISLYIFIVSRSMYKRGCLVKEKPWGFTPHPINF